MSEFCLLIAIGGETSEAMGHTFIALVPGGVQENAEIKRLMGKVKRTFTEREIEARWTPPDLWHVTLLFLGELGPDRVSELHRRIESWKADFANLVLRIKGVGGFPAPEQARVLWLGVQENQQLLDLQTNLRSHLQDFVVEDKPFQPHLTLARLRNHSSITDVINLGGRRHFGDYPIREVVVFESVLQGNIVRYLPRLVVPAQSATPAPE